MKNSPPHTFVILLCMAVATRLVFLLLFGSGLGLLSGLLLCAVFASFSVRAIRGSDRPARQLGYLYYAFGAFSLLSAFFFTRAEQVAFGAVWGILAISTAWYIFNSKELHAFYARSSVVPVESGG